MDSLKDNSQRFVKMTNHGMINIPAPLRKRYGFKDGDEILI
jgi:bifunctional DNA-binding transcriptional regulator/antitoxin component of YhaV-PrlF toxin-antitoxin module